MDMDQLTIILILIGIIQIILILSVVHISAKSDEISNHLAELKEIMRNANKKGPLPIKENSPPTPRNTGSEWTCPDCKTVNSNSQRICKGCGRDK